MKILFIPTLVLHVLVAVLGLGSTASIAIVVASTRRMRRDQAALLLWLGPLLRWSAFSLAAMLASGILLDLAAKGAFRASWWFRGSALLLIAAGAINGQARRIVRSWVPNQSNSDTLLLRVERLAFAMCAAIAGITILSQESLY